MIRIVLRNRPGVNEKAVRARESKKEKEDEDGVWGSVMVGGGGGLTRGRTQTKGRKGKRTK